MGLDELLVKADEALAQGQVPTVAHDGSPVLAALVVRGAQHLHEHWMVPYDLELFHRRNWIECPGLPLDLMFWRPS